MSLVTYSLVGCGFSRMAENLINEHNIKNVLHKVEQKDKDEYKKLNDMNTFPQIFIEHNNKNLKIGGYSNLNDIFNIVNSKKKLDNITKELSEYLNIDYNQNKRIILELINLLIKKL